MPRRANTVVIINGAARADGNTDTVIKHIIKGLKCALKISSAP